MNLLALDPGAARCGWARFVEGWCADTGECSPDELLGVVCTSAPRPDVLVVEEFRLYGSAAESLIGLALPTVEAMGAIRREGRSAHV